MDTNRTDSAMLIPASKVVAEPVLTDFGEFLGATESKILWQEKGVPIKTFAMGIASVEPGATLPMHRHNVEEGFIFLEGQGYYRVENDDGGWDKLPFQAGDALFIKENYKHGQVNTGDGPTKFVYVVGHMLEAFRDEWCEVFPDERPDQVVSE